MLKDCLVMLVRLVCTMVNLLSPLRYMHRHLSEFSLLIYFKGKQRMSINQEGVMKP